MSRVSFDRNAAEANANRAQRAFLTASIREASAKARNAAHMRAAVLTGLAVGVIGAAAQLLLGV